MDNLRGNFKQRGSFKLLCYSEIKEGVVCKYYVLFLESDYGGKGSHEELVSTSTVIDCAKSRRMLSKYFSFMKNVTTIRQQYYQQKILLP